MTRNEPLTITSTVSLSLLFILPSEHLLLSPVTVSDLNSFLILSRSSRHLISLCPDSVLSPITFSFSSCGSVFSGAFCFKSCSFSRCSSLHFFHSMLRSSSAAFVVFVLPLLMNWFMFFACLHDSSPAPKFLRNVVAVLDLLFHVIRTTSLDLDHFLDLHLRRLSALLLRLLHHSPTTSSSLIYHLFSNGFATNYCPSCSFDLEKLFSFIFVLISPWILFLLLLLLLLMPASSIFKHSPPSTNLTFFSFDCFHF